MRATIVILLGLALVTFTGVSRFWRLFELWADLVEPADGVFLQRTARAWDIDEDRFHRVWIGVFRWLSFSIGAAMIVGALVFMIQHGWMWDW